MAKLKIAKRRFDSIPFRLTLWNSDFFFNLNKKYIKVCVFCWNSKNISYTIYFQKNNIYIYKNSLFEVVDNFSQLSTGAIPLFKPHKNSLILFNFLSLAWISGFSFHLNSSSFHDGWANIYIYISIPMSQTYRQ